MERARFACRLSLLLAVASCAASSPEAAPPRVPVRDAIVRAQSTPAPLPCPVRPESALTDDPEPILPDARVPEFRLATKACRIFDSHEMVGKRPFAVVFFASWCSVCEHKMPELSAALAARAGELTSLFVSLDEPDAWRDTEAFAERHGLSSEVVVAGRDFLSFSLGYNPFRSVPVVVIVGRSGRVVDVQIGVRDGDEQRLALALDAAIEQAPEPRRLTSFPRP